MINSEALESEKTAIKKLRPIWLNVALMAASLILLAIIIFAIFFPEGTLGQAARGGDKALPLLLFVGIVAAIIFCAFGGINIVKTFKHRSDASYRREDEEDGRRYIYHITPTRISLVALLLPLVTGTTCYLLISFLAIDQEVSPDWASLFSLVGFTILLIAIVLTLSYILPGARQRKTTVITISPYAVELDDIRLPLDEISGFDMIYVTGIGEISKPIHWKDEGIPATNLIVQGLRSRMAVRSFAVRAHREDNMSSLDLAGGLTEDCARSLLDDIVRVTGKV